MKAWSNTIGIAGRRLALTLPGGFYVTVFIPHRTGLGELIRDVGKRRYWSVGRHRDENQKAMRPRIRAIIVGVLRFAIRRRPDHVLQLRCGLERILPHRDLAEIAVIWQDACKGTWLERDKVAESWIGRPP